MRIAGAENEQKWTFWLVALLVFLATIRLLGIVVTPLNLYADEAQYWRWGTELHWGYYSKPPMIAWVINLFTSIFGTSEWAIRLPGALLHTGAAWCLYLLGRDMYSAKIGFFATCLYVLMPAVSLSSGLISTDGILMPFWCLALLCLWRMRTGHKDLLTTITLGIAIGCGLLSKYAMVYFLIGLTLALVLDPATRRAVISRRGIIAAVFAILVFAPHIAWNMANDFKTVSHTLDNASLESELFNPENAVTFLVDQLGVFGPISFLTLLFGVLFFRTVSTDHARRDQWLLLFVLPVLAFILFQAVLTRANANWAATAYPAGSVLVAAWLVNADTNRWLWIIISAIIAVAFLFIPDMTMMTRLIVGGLVAGIVFGVGKVSQYKPEGLVWTSLGLHGVVAMLLFAIAILPQQQSSSLGFDNALKRAKGWDVAAEAIMAKAEEFGATAILVDEREVWHGLDYYSRDRAIPLLSWRRYGGPKSFAEAQPLTDDIDDLVLVASIYPDFRKPIKDDFETSEHIGFIEIPLGVRSNGCPIIRRFELYLVGHHTPQERTPEWEEKYKGQMERQLPPCKPRLTGTP